MYDFRLILIVQLVGFAFGEVNIAESKNCSQVNAIHQDLHCDGPGKFPLKDNCTFFYECVPSEGKDFQLVKAQCPDDTHFDGVACVARNGTDEACPLVLCPILGDFADVPIAPENLGQHNTTELNADEIEALDEFYKNKTAEDNEVLAGDDPRAYTSERMGSYKSRADEIPKTDAGDHKSTEKPKPAGAGHGDHHDHDHSHRHSHGHRRKVTSGGVSFSIPQISPLDMLMVVFVTLCVTLVSA